MLRRHPVRILILLVLCGLAFVFRKRLETHFAAPEADYTPEAVLAPEYPRPGANLNAVWSVPVERGHGGAALDGEDVFLLDREVGVRDTLRVFDLETGTERWSFSYDSPGRLEFAGSRTKPTVVDDLVYLCGGFGKVHCVDRKTHSARWGVDLTEDCGGRQPDFGWAASPLVHADLVILPALGEDAGLVALDRFSGATRWTTPGVGFSHSTPVVLDLLDEQHLVFLSTAEQGRGADGRVPMSLTSFDLNTGDLRWTKTIKLTSVPIPPAVRVDRERFVVTGGYGGGTSVLRIRKEGSGYAIEEEFHVEKGSQLHAPIVHDEHIYLLANENLNESRRRRGNGGLICLDLEGNELWATGDDPNFGRGSMMLLGEHLLIQDGMSGMLRMCLASPLGYKQVATANVFESPPKARRRMWAPMVRSGGEFVVRGEDSLRCVHLSSGARNP
jgi:outer membrane protein assembly factor BamB